MTIRKAEPRDYRRIVELRNLAEHEPMTLEDLLRIDADYADNDFLYRAVMELDGEIVGAGQVSRNLWIPPGIHRLFVWVDIPFRRRGLGTSLLHHLEDRSRQSGAEVIESKPPDNEKPGIAFLGRYGYRQVAHTFESVLDLRSFDPDHFDSWRNVKGARFFALSETNMDESVLRNMWELNTETSKDEPHNDPDYAPTFEEFTKGVIEASWFDPNGQFIAEVDGRWAGISAVGCLRAGSMSNLFTGVHREFRGKGIAKALKLLATEYARQSGVPTIRTNNDSRNEPMLAINRQLGYVARPGWLMFRRPLETIAQRNSFKRSFIP